MAKDTNRVGSAGSAGSDVAVPLATIVEQGEPTEVGAPSRIRQRTRFLGLDYKVTSFVISRLHQAELEETVRAGSVIAVASRAEPGCIQYRYAIDIEDPLVLQLFEHWESATALEAHFATPHFLAFSEVLLRAADGEAEFTRFEVSPAAPLFG